MSFNNLLVITDNPSIGKRFVDEIVPLIKSKIDIQFACSPFSNIQDFKMEGIEALELDLRDQTSVSEIINKFDLVFSLHCKQLFPENLVKSVRCINIHPGYNPVNRGWYPQVFSIINDAEIGATIHEIDIHIDNGNIIDQEKVEKYAIDTSLSLYNRVVNMEMFLLKRNINKILADNYSSKEVHNEGNLNHKKDFNRLCKLNLKEEMTMGKAINILRALTHEPYSNAYFLDENKKKIYVSINLKYES